MAVSHIDSRLYNPNGRVTQGDSDDLFSTITHWQKRLPWRSPSHSLPSWERHSFVASEPEALTRRQAISVPRLIIYIKTHIGNHKSSRIYIYIYKSIYDYIYLLMVFGCVWLLTLHTTHICIASFSFARSPDDLHLENDQQWVCTASGFVIFRPQNQGPLGALPASSGGFSVWSASTEFFWNHSQKGVVEDLLLWASCAR